MFFHDDHLLVLSFFFYLSPRFIIEFGSRQQQAAVLTLVAAVFKLGVVIVLVCNHDGDLADPDERFIGLVRGRDRQRKFPLTLSVKADCRADVTWRDHVTTTTVTNA